MRPLQNMSIECVGVANNSDNVINKAQINKDKLSYTMSIIQFVKF